MFQLLSTAKSQINIDCIKTCPFDVSLIAFAYYQQDPMFTGGIALCRIQDKNIVNLPIQIIEPLLHLAWAKSITNRYLLAAACRCDRVLIFEVEPIKLSLLLVKEIKLEIGIFCLYLDFVSFNQKFRLIVSSNQSTVYEIDLDQDLNHSEIVPHRKHQYAVWTCRLNPSSPQTFVCGDQVNSLYLYQKGKMISKNSKAHTQGICDIVFYNEWSILSGGFDGKVAQLDIRKFTDCVKIWDFGGTIWRVVPKPQEDLIFLCNSSQKKFQVFGDHLQKEIWNSGQVHESLAYAGDWSGDALVTASFYDQKLCLWEKIK